MPASPAAAADDPGRETRAERMILVFSMIFRCLLMILESRLATPPRAWRRRDRGPTHWLETTLVAAGAAAPARPPEKTARAGVTRNGVNATAGAGSAHFGAGASETGAPVSGASAS